MGGERTISQNDLAESVMGRRPTDCIAFDQPVELGFWCPVCRVEPVGEDGQYDERLHWSEYNCFIWCEVCNFDFPSALCVPLHLTPDPKRPYVYAGPEAAVQVYLDTVLHALADAQTAARSASDGPETKENPA